MCLKRLTLGLVLLRKGSILLSTFCTVVWRSRCHQLEEVDGLARGYPTALGWPEALLSVQTKGYLHRNFWRKSESPVSQLSLALPGFRRGQRCHGVSFAPSFQATRLLVGVLVVILSYLG